MKKSLNLLLPYGVDMANPHTGAIIKPKMITYNFISWCVRDLYQNGIEGDDLHIWGNLQKSLEDIATSEDVNELMLDEREIQFIKAACIERKVRFGVQEARFAVVFLQEIIKQLC